MTEARRRSSLTRVVSQFAGLLPLASLIFVGPWAFVAFVVVKTSSPRPPAIFVITLAILVAIVATILRAISKKDGNNN
jgi:hypothetical protein